MLFMGTETPLAASATWHSTDSGPGYALPSNLQQSVYGTVFSDAAGTLYVEQSPDGINWDVISSPVTVTANTGVAVSEPVTGFYIRLRYVNGAAIQTVFRLACNLNNSGSNEPV
jgi:hypothetical protein